MRLCTTRFGALLALLDNPVQPITRFPVQMRDGDNQYVGLQDLIGYSIRKPSSLASAAVLGERMPRFGKLPNSLQ